MNDLVNSKPLVSVVMITYNHEKYIAEAINGVLMQKCDFDFELIIADDNSPDNTERVIGQFSNHQFFKRIKYIKHAQNKGVMNNFFWALNQARGKYVALCEGDDYWTDSLKLKKQVDFLESNNLYEVVAHNTNVVNSRSNINVSDAQMFHIKRESSNLLPFEIISKKTPFHTSSILFGRKLIEDITINDKIFSGDLWLFFCLFLKTKIYVLRDYMSVYRINDFGVTFDQSTKNYNELILNRIFLWNFLNSLKKNPYKKDIQDLVSQYINDLIWKNKNNNFDVIKKIFIFFITKYNFKIIIIFSIRFIKFKLNARFNNYRQL